MNYVEYALFPCFCFHWVWSLGSNLINYCRVFYWCWWRIFPSKIAGWIGNVSGLNRCDTIWLNMYTVYSTVWATIVLSLHVCIIMNLCMTLFVFCLVYKMSTILIFTWNCINYNCVWHLNYNLLFYDAIV